MFVNNHICDLVSPPEGRAGGPGWRRKEARVREGGEVQWEAEISDNGIKLQCLDLEKGGGPI